MKKLFLSALMLTGLLATAQEPATTTTQPAQQTITTASDVKTQATPATTTTQAQPAKPATTVTETKKTEATVNEKPAVKKADPAKKTK